ncbi:unnamed protein product [Leptidea sinapis]|uniref:DNA repair protein RAD51 homolog 3 n=2 Tax=Leptidea sinapis TaxID=189913 RepID=A0A5E4R166_9NEOP|nr:unnamed protein product [Leptidea sinapis]
MIINAAGLWQKETSLPTIATFSRSLDNVLGNNGIQLGSITEVLGLSGTGKTQLCLQLCASVQVPKSLGGLEAEALYIDTNTNFNLNRFKEILLASLEKCHNILKITKSVNIEDALRKLHYVRTSGLEKFCSLMYTLPKFIEERPNVRIIAIDSIIDPFKEGITLQRRTGLLFRLMADLQRIAVSRQIAIVLMNQMSTRIGLSTGAVVGALGDGWAHRCNIRLLLSAPRNVDAERVAALLKSNSSPETVGRFRICQDGIRDIL